MYLFIALIIIMAATPAWAFNALQLADPAFQRFVLLEVPLASVTGMALLDTLMLLLFLRRRGVSAARIAGLMLRENAAAMLLNIGLIFLLMFYVTGIMKGTEYLLPILFGVGYFMLAFMGVAWWRKRNAAVRLLDTQKRCVNITLMVTTILGYGVLYYYLYQRMCAGFYCLMMS